MSLYDIYACTNGEYIYKFYWLDEEWKPLMSAGKRQWRGITCSDNGTIVLACAWKDHIYKSTNNGITWVPITTSIGKRSWTAISCSSDCKIIVACATWSAADSTGDYVWISKNSGASWSKASATIGINGNGISFWSSISCSSNSAVIAAAELFGNVWVSKDSGVTWTNSSSSSQTFPLTNFNTSDICVSSDGTTITLVTIPNSKDIGNVFTSNDSGDTWEFRFPLDQTSNCVTCSADGTVIAVGSNENFIYTSTNSGFSFSQQFSSGLNKWSTITISPDNDYFVAAAYNDHVYESTDGINWKINKSSPEKQWIDSTIAKNS